jgi:hypothetical protein
MHGTKVEIRNRNFINSLKLTGYVKHQVQHSTIVRSAHTVFVCFVFENKQQQLEPLTSWTDWFYNRDGNCLERGTEWAFK